MKKVFNKVMIANRGEIAVRIIKACQEMGINTLAIYSDVDSNAPHVRMADDTVALGDPTPSESYLNISKIIDAAKNKGAEAIHPGYGFLAENPEFAKACENAGIVFIGPKPEVIRLMGDKIEAKTHMGNADVPVIPGYHKEEQNIDSLLEAGKEIGFPLIVKASAGGGGKGMRIVKSEEGLQDAIESCQREAKSSFGDGTLLMERYLSEPRHIEYQILGDNHGNVVHLFERECSIQRRHQKIIEETPSTALTPELRKEMGEAALRAAKAVGYTNAGTVEFMYSKGDYYFMEMNTRLQVEHPITEMTTGIDLVKWQLRIAAGEELTLKQDDIVQRGHSIECRIYAEDPEKNFLPSTGHIQKMEVVHGVNVRHDLGVETDVDVPVHYDPMLAKLIVYDQNREDAIQKMLWALTNYVVLGVTTNITFLKEIIKHEAFKRGEITTHFIDDNIRDWSLTKEGLPLEALVAASLYDVIHASVSGEPRITHAAESDPHSPWKHSKKWRLGGHEGGK
jgi:acetyl-CoA carboxylase biotin carboxylase subunit